MAFGWTSAGRGLWPGTGRDGSADKAQADERIVREGFWSKIARTAGRVPFAEELLSAYYCAFDRQTPTHVRVTLVGALAYFVLPLDAIPDILPILGFADDAAILATAVKLVVDNIRPEHREAARRKLEEFAKL